MQNEYVYIILGVIGFILLVIIIIKNRKDIAFPKGTIESLSRFEHSVLSIAVPKNNDKSAFAAEQLFASLHGMYKTFVKVPIVSLEMYARGNSGVQFVIVSPKEYVSYIKSQVYAQYPLAQISEVEDYMLTADQWDPSAHVVTGEIKLEREYVFPLKTFRDFEVDPMAAIASSISQLETGEEAYIQIVTRPYPNIWQKTSQKYISKLRAEGNDIFHQTSIFEGLGNLFSGAFRFFTDGLNYDSSKQVRVIAPVIRLEPFQEEEIKRVELKSEKPGFQTQIRVLAKAYDPARASQLFDGIVSSFKQYATAHLNTFSLDTSTSTTDTYHAIRARYLPMDNANILTIEELASVYHLPNTVDLPTSMYWTTTTKLPPPQDLEFESGTIYGRTDFRGESKMFGISKEDKRRHVYIVGRTGTGKTNLMRNMIISDILAGEGVALIDPHGETAEYILDYIPEQRIDDVIYFNPGDQEYPIGFNPIHLKDKSQRDLVADSIVVVFKKYFESWGPRLEHLLYNCIITTLESQGCTLLSVQRILTDKKYRKRVLSHVKDKMIHRFWDEEFKLLEENKRLYSDAIAPIQNKVGRYLSPKLMRNILGQTRSAFNIRDIMDNRKIFIANLSKGKIGEQNTSLLGALLVARMYTSAMERVDVPENDRVDFSLYIDEVHSFTTDAFVNILSEARKYHLSLIINHQFTEQLPFDMLKGVFGNVGTMIGFSVSQTDSKILADEFAPYVTTEDFLSLPKFHFYTRMVIKDRISEPFSAISLPPRYEPFNLKETIRALSREKFAVPRQEIEDKISKWAGGDTDEST